MRNWRDKQLSSFGTNNILTQEKVLLDFLKISNSKNIKWDGDSNGLFETVKQHYTITDIDQADTCVIFGNVLMNKTLTEISNIIKEKLIIKNLYVGINRFAIEQENYNLSLPDSLEETLNEVVFSCHQKFQRLAEFKNISGNTFVFAHPQDLYGLCR
jgi:hypothetical protein